MAIVLPLLFLIFLAAFDISRANMIRNTINNAAFEAARFSTIPGATEAEVQAVAMDSLAPLSIHNASVTMEPSVILDTTEEVTVTVTVPLSENLYCGSDFLLGRTMTKSCSLLREQFAVETLE